MESNEDDLSLWQVKVGALAGYGDMAWEQCGDRIRKLTMTIPIPGGQVGFQKPLSVNLMEGQETNEFEAEKLVIVGKKPRKEFIEDFKRFWTGSSILVPGNTPKAPLQFPRR